MSINHSSSEPSSLAARLAELNTAFERKLISQEEYTQTRTQLLDAMTVPQQQPTTPLFYGWQGYHHDKQMSCCRRVLRVLLWMVLIGFMVATLVFAVLSAALPINQVWVNCGTPGVPTYCDYSGYYCGEEFYRVGRHDITWMNASCATGPDGDCDPKLINQSQSVLCCHTIYKLMDRSIWEYRSELNSAW